jgi:hypothetical protein
MVGLLTAAGVYLIYNNSVPNLSDLHAAPPHDADVESARKGAAIKSAVLVGLVFLVARDVNSYIISGAALVGMDYMVKHHNAVGHNGKIDTGTVSVAPGLSQAYPLPEYQTDVA